MARQRPIPPVKAWNIEAVNGGKLISTIYFGVRLHRFYVGYTTREAIRLFRQYLRTEQI